MSFYLRSKASCYLLLLMGLFLLISNPSRSQSGQKKVITGLIKDETNTPVANASVMLLGSTKGVVSDSIGKFTLSVPNDFSDTIVVSHVSFVNYTFHYHGQENIDIVLKKKESDIDAVVVSTGYQQLSKKLFTGASATVKAIDAERNGVPDVSRMLEGQVAGLSVQNVSGTFGAAPKIRIRGATSLSGDNKPLWVVDGIILEDVVNISNEALSTGDANTLIGSSVAGLNPNDIESFTILKDAAATAMYGARAMNGVIVVTTKKGKDTKGRANINYVGNFTSYLKPSYGQFDIMNSADQMSVMIEMENKGFLRPALLGAPQNGGIFYKLYNSMYNYDSTTGEWALKNDQNLASRNSFLERYARANTDWFNVLFKNSLLQEHSISLTTGSEKFQNYFSTSYMNDNGMTLGDNVKRYTLNNRSTVKINKRLSVEFIGTASVRDQRTPGTLTRQSDPVFGSYSRNFDINPYSYSLNTSRLMTPYDENGDLEYFIRNYAPFNIINELNNNYLKLHMMDIKIQGGIKYNILPGLNFATDASLRYAQTTREHYIKEGSNMAEAFRAYTNTAVIEGNTNLYDDPDNTDLPVVILPDGGFFNVTENKILSYYLRNNLDYTKTIKQHLFKIYLANEIRTADRQNYNFDGVGYQYENGGLVNTNYRYIKKVSEGGGAYFGMNEGRDRFMAYLLNAAYNFGSRYTLNATTRLDGSNKMGRSDQARWLPTWNISGSWDIDQENFFKPSTILNAVRLRATYGLVANTGNATNTSTVYYNRISRRPFEKDKEAQTYINNLENSDLTWEKLYELNIGTNITMFDERINITMDYYKRKSFDLITTIQTSGIGGEDTKRANNGDMTAHGFEFTLAGNVIRPSSPNGFAYRTQLNFAFNKNKITRQQVNPNIWNLVRAEGGNLVGHSQAGLYSIKFDGLDPNNGSPTFINEYGVKDNYVWLQNNYTDYLKYEGPVDPTFTGGFFNKVDYAGFSFSALFTYAFGNKVRLQPIFSSSYNDMYSMSKIMQNRWIMPGDETKTNVPSILDKYTIANFKRLSTGTSTDPAYAYNAYNYSDQRVAKGDYVRLKTISLSYLMPKRIVDRMGLTSMQFALVANNIALLYADKKLLGQDPEFFNNGGVAMPIPKQYTFSLKVGL
ncbi:MAG: SusC/RagA family protein [Pseudopedobacter saltans]|uniref:SusC/RagA family protein n=1 Tax=Pseudopedobacter saltans TaxID=151895 RepID=A0A2W5F705_9SPHI|nr:MAG: SusC/RagA family protein [Pseudopedobacter saltans]